MKNLRHSNNTGTVGWTNITADMSLADMQELHLRVPEGYFTCTFFMTSEESRVMLKDQRLGALYYMVKYCPAGTKRWYFEFPVAKSDEGKALLVWLRMVHNMEVSNGKHA